MIKWLTFKEHVINKKNSFQNIFEAALQEQAGPAYLYVLQSTDRTVVRRDVDDDVSDAVVEDLGRRDFETGEEPPEAFPLLAVETGGDDAVKVDVDVVVAGLGLARGLR